MARKPKHVVPTPALETIVHVPEVVKQLHQHALQDDGRISSQEIAWTLGFLKYFGYLNGKALENVHWRDFKKAIQAYQHFSGLAASGTLDQRTANAMQAPRCGVSDIEPLRQQLKLTDGAPLPLGQPKWNKPAITYGIERYLTGIPRSVQDDIIDKAYRNWSSICGLKITRIKDAKNADIVISTGRGPRNQFDGPGNTLAWAYLPPGDDRQLLMMYDEDENFVAELSGVAREIRLEEVTTHEGGHTLGLEHSKVRGALMGPYYSPGLFMPVSPDDVERIQKLYGKPTAPPPPPPTPPGTGLVIQLAGKIDSVSIPGYRVTKLALVSAAPRKPRKKKK